jgi:hypothetical protein
MTTKDQKPPYTWPIGDEHVALWMIRLDPAISSTPGIITTPLNAFVEGIVEIALRRLREELATGARAVADRPAESAA